MFDTPKSKKRYLKTQYIFHTPPFGKNLIYVCNIADLGFSGTTHTLLRYGNSL